MTTYSDWMTFVGYLVAVHKARFGFGSSFTAGTIPLAQFYTRKLPWDVEITYPCVCYVPLDPRLGIPTNAQVDWFHGVQVSICQASNRDQESDHDRLHAWYEAAIKDLHGQRLLAANAWWLEVEPRQVIDPYSFANNFDVASFVVRGRLRSNRPTPLA